MFQCEVCKKDHPTSMTLMKANGVSVCRTKECMSVAVTRSNAPGARSCHHCQKTLGASIPVSTRGLYFCSDPCSAPYMPQ